MGAPAKHSRKPSRRPRQPRNGHKASSGKKSRNGHKSVRGRKNGQIQPPDPLARDLIAAVASSSGGANGNGSASLTNGKTHVTKAQARRVAVEFGGAMLEATNLETARHSDDVVVIVRALCEQLEIKGSERQDLLAAARLHDIGKAAMPVEVLQNPGPLTDAEWELMRQHTLVGEQILGSVAELQGIARLVKHSHERWDGCGYPDGLAGEEIPLGSRVIFCADAFHAIRSDRPYRAGRPAAASLEEVKRGAGTQFDPRVVGAFEEVVRQLRLVPAGSGVRRTSRLTALLLMLAIGTAGSAVAESGLLGEPQSDSGPAPGAPPTASSQLLGLSFDDLIQAQRSPAAVGAPFSAAPRPGLGLGDASEGVGDRPGGGQTGTGGETGAGGGPGGSETGSSGGGSGGDSGHPHGGPPGQTGDHPQGGPPGQTGNHPNGGAPGQTGNHSQGGPPGQPGGGPPGQSKKPK